MIEQIYDIQALTLIVHFWELRQNEKYGDYTASFPHVMYKIICT